VGKEVVNRRHVHAKLTQVPRIKVSGLQLDHHEAPQTEVIEEQIGVEILISDL
jgi:hypothetical protein